MIVMRQELHQQDLVMQKCIMKPSAATQNSCTRHTELRLNWRMWSSARTSNWNASIRARASEAKGYVWFREGKGWVWEADASTVVCLFWSASDRALSHTACCARGSYSSGAACCGSSTTSIVTNKQPASAQPVPLVKAPGATMPRTMGRGFQSIRPRWTGTKDAHSTSTIPPASLASLGTPCVPQPGALGSLMSNPSQQMPQPVETHILSASQLGWSMGHYRGTVQGHVELPDDDDFDDMEVLDFRVLKSLSIQHRMLRQHCLFGQCPTSTTDCHQAQLRRLPQQQLSPPCLLYRWEVCRDHRSNACLMETRMQRTSTIIASNSRMEVSERLPDEGCHSIISFFLKPRNCLRCLWRKLKEPAETQKRIEEECCMDIHSYRLKLMNDIFC